MCLKSQSFPGALLAYPTLTDCDFNLTYFRTEGVHKRVVEFRVEAVMSELFNTSSTNSCWTAGLMDLFFKVGWSVTRAKFACWLWEHKSISVVSPVLKHTLIPGFYKISQ